VGQAPGPLVVIKGLLNIKDETQRELARAEARSLSAVKHPNIVQVYDLIEGDPTQNEPDYIVMEYVGGKTLMALRKERGTPLPVAEACAYILGILPAFGYLRADRRLQVRHEFRAPGGGRPRGSGVVSPPVLLPLPREGHRPDPDDRFQTAGEAEEQLRGVLRLLVAETASVPPAESAVYSGDVQELVGSGTDRVTGRALPVPRADANDPAAGLIDAASRERDLSPRVAMLHGALKQSQFAQSVDLPLEVAATLVDEGDYQAAERQLAEVERDDPFEWRVPWLRGRILLAQGHAAEARRLFEQVDGELPGELAPKLACLVASRIGVGVKLTRTSLLDVIGSDYVRITCGRADYVRTCGLRAEEQRQEQLRLLKALRAMAQRRRERGVAIDPGLDSLALDPESALHAQPADLARAAQLLERYQSGVMAP
jgi:Protein kinase G tetratricopeptide repeat/Protein tyrosine and serine/threonine kinase